MRPDPTHNAPDPGFVPGVQPDTLPMSRSPYNNRPIGAPPPPPASGPLWQPPSSPAPSRRGLIVGIISAVIFVALAATVGLFFADPALFATAKTGITATATAVPATVPPTATLTATPTLTPSPTATDTPMPTATIPSTPSGFQSYTGGSDWTIGYPPDATYTQGSVSIQGISVPDVRFNLGHSAQFTIYDSPVAVSTSLAPQILMAALTADGATNITTIDQPAPTTIGAVTWLRTKVSATLNGQPTIFVALYVAHGSGAIAIAYSAPASTFATIEAQTCLPMVQTFLFAS